MAQPKGEGGSEGVIIRSDAAGFPQGFLGAMHENKYWTLCSQGCIFEIFEERENERERERERERDRKKERERDRERENGQHLWKLAFDFHPMRTLRRYRSWHS